MLDNLTLGFSVAASLENLGACLLGVLLGTAIGVLPGIGPITTISLLLPLTFGMDPATGLIMLAGIYYGAQYGGSTTSILMNLPGEVSAVVTAIDGYKMAGKGEAGAALAAATIGSFVAGTLATLLIAAAGPALAKVALAFGPPEYFSLVLLGLIVSAVLGPGSAIKSILMVLAGIALSFIGTDLQTGEPRFTFGVRELYDGVGFTVMAVGMFGIAEIIRCMERPPAAAPAIAAPARLWLTPQQWRRIVGPVLRGAGAGSLIGMLPGGGASLAALGAYALERRAGRNRRLLGSGAIEGVAAPESANNAAAQTGFIPLLTLGIPPNAVMALMVGALMIHGIQPGPRMLEGQPAIFWGLIASMWIGNVMLLFINLPMIGLWVRLLRIPGTLLYPAILVFCCMGIYSMNYAALDVLLAAGFGIAGYFLVKLGYPPAPMLIGFVLGPMLEENLVRSMLLSRGDWAIFVERPVSAATLLLTVLAVAVMALEGRRGGRPVAQDD
ncbi:MAG: tripartite tricarboxylate transporter permease [Reyranellaceae bacterium]